MTRINKDFKVTKAVPLNSHYNICNNDYKQYVLSDNHFYLYRLDILCGFSDSDHPEDTFWQSDRSNFNPIHFWATADNENDAFFELVQRVVSFFNVILDNSNINLKNIEKFIDKPNKYPELCQAWIELVIGKNLLINGYLMFLNLLLLITTWELLSPVRPILYEVMVKPDIEVSMPGLIFTHYCIL